MRREDATLVRLGLGPAALALTPILAGALRLVLARALAVALPLASSSTIALNAALPVGTAAATDLSPQARLGRQIFFDASLSTSGSLSCASCHDPANAYAAPTTAGVVMNGGANMDRPGLRAVPSLRYLSDTPRFSRHSYIDVGREREDVGPAGGLMLDGRADNLRAQMLLPLLDPAEMANSSVREVAEKLARSSYAAELRQLSGTNASGHGPKLLVNTWASNPDAQLLVDDAASHPDAPLLAAGGTDAHLVAADASNPDAQLLFAAAASNPDAQLLVAAAATALERFELEDPSFHPYNSRFDKYLHGGEALTADELEGLRLFVDPAKGNCAACHTATTGPGGSAPTFTDHSYHALGVPRNPAIHANADPRFFDLGLCGPRREDLRGETRYCGYFKTPTLRNVTRRRFFFHNGRFTNLRDVMHFYVERDTDSRSWYPTIAGKLRKFDDMPARYRGNVNISDAPLNRGPRDTPALNDVEIAKVITFLGTLSDAD